LGINLYNALTVKVILDFHPSAPALIEEDLMKQQKVTFPNADGNDLAAILHLLEDEEPVAFVLFAHCFNLHEEYRRRGNRSTPSRNRASRLNC